MRTLVQWARSRGTAWEEIDSADWSILPDRGEPVGGEAVDGERGWVQCVNIQGACFSADHIAVEPIDGGVRVYAWNDDRDDWPAGYAHGHIVEILTLAPDPAFGGAFNTRHRHEIFAEPMMKAAIEAASGLRVQHWGAFPLPATALTRHGIWLPDSLHEVHRAALGVRGWREWTQGVPAEEIVGGRVRDQRSLGRYIVPDGTRTYYHNPEALAIGAVDAQHENQLGNGPTTQTSEQGTQINGTGKLVFAAASPASEPDSAAWPTGDYRAQLDVTAADTDLSYGMLTQGTAVGAFHRFSSDLALSLEMKSQQEAAFTLSGLKLATTGSVSWLAGGEQDRWGFAIAGVRTAGHGNKSMTLQLGETDDFTDGPWPAPPAGPSGSMFFGANF